MAKSGTTSRGVASKAGSALQNPNASATQKSLAGSALSQSGNSKQTSARVAEKASDALRDGRTNGVTKTLAGSVLTQKP